MADPKRLKTRKQRRRRPISRGRDRLSGRLRGELLEERRLLAFDPLATVPQWIAQGPAPITGGYTLGLANNPVSGAIQAIAAHPNLSLAGTVYVGSANGGIWKSTNANTAQPDWTAKTDGFPSLSISALAFDPADATNNTLYAGTGHFSSSLSGEASVGLLKTTDGGEHWQSIRKSFFDGKRIVSIVPLNTPAGPVLLVATDHYQPNVNPVQANAPDQGGIFRSTNAHLPETPTFLNVARMSGANRLPAGSITDLVADPGNSSRVYAAVYGKGIYRSDDAGLTWHQVHAGLPVFGTAPAPGTVGFNAQTAVKLSVSAAAGNPVYTALLNPGGGGYQLSAVYQSAAGTDGVDNDLNEGTDEPNETSWTAIGAAPPNLGTQTFSDRSSHFSMLADRASPTLVYIGGQSQPVVGGHIGTLFIGDAAAGTWNTIVDAGAQTTAPHPDSRRMVFDAAGDILEADDGGLYRLDNPSLATRQWFSANGDLQLTELVAAAYDSVNDLLLGGSQDNGAAMQQGTLSPVWNSLTGGDGGIVHVETVSGSGDPFANHYYSSQHLGGFSRKTVGPELPGTVQPIALQIAGAGGKRLTHRDGNNNLTFDASVGFVQPWVLNAIDPSRMLIGTRFLYESFNRGQTLTPLGGIVSLNADGTDNDGDGEPGSPLDASGRALADGADNDGANGADENIDEGDEFAPVSPIGRVTAMAYGGRFPDPAGGSIDVPNVAYVGAGGRLFLRRSQGRPLTQLTSYPGGTVRDIVLDPDNWHTAYLVDANSQVWQTTDAGATAAGWKNLTANLPGPVRTIEVVKTGGATVLLVGGHSGLYRAVNPDNGLSWTRFGRGLPDVIVSDVDYNVQDDVLLVGTMGRGAWIVPNASAHLAQPTVLSVEGTDGIDMITVRRNADAAEMIEFVINGVVSQPLPLASVQSIVVQGFGGLDTLTIDSTGGPISVPMGIEFNGHSDFDTLVFTGPTPISHTLNEPAVDGSGAGWLTANDAFGNQLSQIISFLNLENVQNDLASPATKRLAALGGGLQATADRLNERPQLGQAFAGLDTSLAPAMAGVSHDRGSQVDDAVAATAPGDEGSESGTPLLRRLIESGLGSFSLLAIGEEESFTTSEQLRAALDALDEVDGNVSFMESADATTFDFRMTKRVAGAARLDVLAEALGGSIELDGAINVGADVQVHLVFGVDSGGFFIQPNAAGEPELVVSNVTVDGELTGSGRIGFLGVELTSGTLTVDPGVALSLKLEDPGELANDGMIRLEELGPLAVAASAVLEGNPAADDVVLSGSFVVGALIPGLPAPFELAEAEISLAWPDVTNPASVNVTAQAGGGEDLLNFLNVEGQQILSGFNQLVDWLEEVRDSSVFDTEVPFTNGTTLGEVVDVAGAFRDELMQFLEGEPGTASFSTVQELAVNLARSLNIDLSTLGINYDPATKDLTYHLDFDHAFEVSQVPLDLSLHAGTLAGVSTSSLLSLAAGADMEMDFGVSLASAVSTGSLADAFFVRDASLNAHVDVLADDIDASATLASFSVQVAGGTASGSAVLGVSLLDPATGADDGRITLEELMDGLGDLDSIVSSPGTAIDADFSLPVSADPFLLGGASVELSGLVTGSLDAIDYSLTAEVAGTLVAGLQIIDLGPGQPSNVTLTKADGLNLEARADAFGVNFLLSGELDVSGDFSLEVTAEPFELGGLTIVLVGQVSRTAGVLDYELVGDVSGELLPGITIVELSPGVPSSVSLTKADGLELVGRAEAFGLDLNIDGQFHATGNFNLLVSTEAFDIPGADGDVILAGSIFRNAAGLDWLLTVQVSGWQPAPFVDVPLLTVQLSAAGLAFDALADIGDLEDVHLFGDYEFDSATFALAAAAPLEDPWEPVAEVELTEVLFTVTNRDANGDQTGVTACATADLGLFGSDFTVAACVTPRGTWLVATPEGPSFEPVPGLSLDDLHLVVSSYDFSDDDGSDDFAFDLDTLREVPKPPDGLTGRMRDVEQGINLVATSFLPDGIPGIGGSEVQIGGVIGASLPDMLIEALIVLDQPWVLADVIQIDLLGLRISGQPSLTIFGDGRILHDQIPGLDEDILVRAALSLTTTELNGSLSLLAPVHDVFGVEGLNIIEADVQVGISFVATPVPPPTVGFNFLVETPPIAQDLLSVPATLGASLKVSNIEPIFAMTVIDWVPYGNLGLTQFVVNEGTLVVAPNGGTIGTKVFDRGFSASFDIDIFGTNVAFLGVFDEDTQGVVMEGFVSAFEVAGIGITGEGPDGIYEDGVVSSPTDPDSDNAVVFRAALTAAAPQNNGLAFSGRIDLPGEDEAGNPAFVALSGEFDSLGVVIQGEIQNWAIVPSVILIDEATFTLAILLDNPDQNLVAFTADLDLLGTHIVAAGTLSGQGLALAGSLEPGNQRFAGVRVEQFGFSFSTLPADEHLRVNFQVDLPGAGGLVSVVGGFEDQILELDAQISNWQPIPTMVFAGSLHAEADLDTSSLELDFDVTGNVLGTSTHFVGSIFADPSGLALFATATVGLEFPGGLKVADLVATIDVGYTSPFFISLAADFRLPGTRPADVLLLGGIGTSGVTLAGSIDRWGLVPGLSFDGDLEIEADFQATSVVVNIESDTHLLGTRLSLDGQLLAGPGVFNLDMEGSVRFQGQRFGFVDLDLDVELATSGTASNRQYRLDFDGRLRALGGIIDVQAGATLIAESDGGWLVTATVDFDPPEFSLDLGAVTMKLDFDASMSLQFGSDLDDLGLDLSGKLTASASISGLGSYSKTLASIDVSLNLDTGIIKIPNAKIKILKKFGVPYGIEWVDLNLKMGEPEPPTTTVDAELIRSPFPLPGGPAPSRLEIRGGASPEFVRVLRQGLSIFLPPSPTDTVLVQGADVEGQWVTLLTTTVGNLSSIDIDMGGGNDVIEISPLLNLPATIVGGTGADVIRAGTGPNLIYGGRRPGQEDDNQPGTGFGKPGLPGGIVFTGSQPDRGDLIFGGSPNIFGGSGNDTIFGEAGNDTITGGGGNDLIDGGQGVNIINGQLQIAGTARGDHIVVERDRRIVPIWASNISLDLPVGALTGQSTGVSTSAIGSAAVWLPIDAILLPDDVPGEPVDDVVVLSKNRLGTAVTLFRTPVANLSSLLVAAGAGDDVVEVSQMLTLPLELRGGAGDDVLRGGAGPNILRGGDDDDVLIGSTADDSLFGEAGDDYLDGRGGNDLLDGGPGDNTIVGAAGPDPVEGENPPPVVEPIGSFTVNEGELLTFTVVAGDAAIPGDGDSVYQNDFEGTIGAEWTPVVRNSTPVGGRNFLGEFANDSVRLALAGLPAHTELTLSFDLFIIRSWDGNAGGGAGPDVFDVSLAGGPSLLHTTFGTTEMVSGHEQAYPDAFPGGSHPARTGAAENNTLGYSLFVGEVGQVLPLDSVYRITLSLPHAEAAAEFVFSAAGLTGLSDESWGLDNVVVRLSGGGDGGPLNVQLVKDFVEGPTGSSPFIGAVVNDVLFLSVDHPDLGRQLWKTDGTTAGTMLVKTGLDFGSPWDAVGENFFFRADDGVHGPELWASDGTEAGTRMVKDITPGTGANAFMRMVVANGKLYLSIDDFTSGVELWVSDGTEAGTMLVKDILPGSGASRPDFFTVVDDKLFFVANDGVVGRELWVTDGTEAGTRLVNDLTPGTTGSGPLDLTEAGGKLFFSQFRTGNGIELWVSDGTAAGTNQVKDIFPGNCSPFAVLPCSGSPSELVEMDDTLYFRGNSSLGPELWKSDGTFDGTVIVKDINEGSEESFPNSLINVAGTLMFFADGPETGFELWKSDGTEAGTVLVKDINPGPTDSARLGRVSSMSAVGNILYFIGCDQSDSQDDPTNCELWRSDGTPEGTLQVHDFGPGLNDRDPLSSEDTPGRLFDFNGTLLFTVDDGVHGEELWRLTSQLPGESVYSFRDDFSTTANPAGPWSYGFLDPAGDFQLHPDGSLHSDGKFKWHGPGVPDSLGLGLPAVFSTLVHPGSNGEKNAVRWTAPADGLYEIEVAFSDADNATTDVAVLHQSQVLSSGFVNLNGQGDSTSFSLTQFVFAGQAIDFVVGDGGNGYISDSTGLDATITLVTAVTFSAAADFSATDNPAGPWSYGWSDPGGGTFSLFPQSNLDPDTGVVEWNDIETFDSFFPAVFFNAGNAEAFVGTCATAAIQPGQLALHPGSGGAEASTVRWTAPAAGTYSITATFTGIDIECHPSATVFVLHNIVDSEPSELFFDSIDDDGDAAAFTGSVTVAAGETLDFLVNDGGDGRFGDTILLDVVIRGEASTPPPPPPSPGAGAVTFSLDPGAPEGAAIDPQTGVFTWTPAAQHGPGAYIVTVRVTDEGTPPVSTTQTFLVTVVDPNEAPQIAAIDPVSVEQGATLAIDVLATDPDVPANRIAFSLDEGAPAEASIDPRTGRFTWRPLRSTEPGSYDVTVRVTDNGEPALDATATFSITVTERPLPPSRDPESGSFVIDPDGVAVYTKADSFQHVDRLAYLDDDGDDGVNLVTAEFTSEPFRNVSSLYGDLLGRGASDGEVIDWTGRLDDATFRGVAGEFLASREYVQNVVQELFQSLLDRPADQGGLDFWTGQLLSGTPTDTVRALITASEEYFAQHASAREDFVLGLYEDLLERTPGEEEVAFWRTSLEQGASRDAVAKGFLASAEFRALLIQEWYRDYLYREADEAGLDHWLNVMTTSQAQRQVQLELLASQEYQSEERLARGRLPRAIGPFEPD